MIRRLRSSAIANYRPGSGVPLPEYKSTDKQTIWIRSTRTEGAVLNPPSADIPVGVFPGNVQVVDPASGMRPGPKAGIFYAIPNWEAKKGGASRDRLHPLGSDW